MNDKEFLENIKAGDEVLLSGGGWGQAKKQVLIVSRTTKTQIIIGSSRYNKKSGYPVGSSCGSWDRPNSIGPVTDKDKADIKRSSAINMLKKTEWENLHDGTLFEIARLACSNK